MHFLSAATLTSPLLGSLLILSAGAVPADKRSEDWCIKDYTRAPGCDIEPGSPPFTRLYTEKHIYHFQFNATDPKCTPLIEEDANSILTRVRCYDGGAAVNDWQFYPANNTNNTTAQFDVTESEGSIGQAWISAAISDVTAVTIGDMIAEDQWEGDVAQQAAGNATNSSSTAFAEVPVDTGAPAAAANGTVVGQGNQTASDQQQPTGAVAWDHNATAQLMAAASGRDQSQMGGGGTAAGKDTGPGL